jgi:3-hydroxyisobutyrate dehydrogenase-like beta-hydroxyacid dehydrogenase
MQSRDIAVDAYPSFGIFHGGIDVPYFTIDQGDVTISSTPADVDTAIDAVAEANINMTFKLDATVSAGVVASASKTLTLTLTDS